MMQSLLTQFSKQPKSIQKQNYELQTVVLVNRNSAQSKNNYESDNNKDAS